MSDVTQIVTVTAALISDNLTDSISRRAEHGKALLCPQTLQQHQLQPRLPRRLQENDEKYFR